MAQYGPDDFTFTIDANTFEEYTDTFAGFSVEAIMEASHTFGDTWTEQLYSGLRRAGEFTIEGFYNDVANGPDALFAGNEGTSMAFILTYGGSKTSTFSAFLSSWTRDPQREGTTRYTATFIPSGAVTEA